MSGHIYIQHEAKRSSSSDIATQDSGANSSGEENDSFEDTFRGFEKLPRVRLERFDITKYLDEEKKRLRVVQPKPLSQGTTIIPKFLQACFVRLVRDDLNSLKQIYTRNKLQNKQTDGDESLGARLKCKICEKSYSIEKKLQNHEENKHLLVYKSLKKPKRVSFSDHVIVHEVKEYHRCRKCPKIFENYTALKVHMKRTHKKRTCYICNYCSKKFVDRMFFKVHIKLHCEVCGQLLSNKRKLTEHRRNVCKVVKKYTCKTCNDAYFRFMDLKDHSYDHLGTFFICDICKDQFETKCEVAHHIQFLHSTNPPKDLYDIKILDSKTMYLCGFCEKTSVHKDVMENHVSTLPNLRDKAMTSYNDFYFCDRCLKKFKTESSMLQHIETTQTFKSRDNLHSPTKPSLDQNVPKDNLKLDYSLKTKLKDRPMPLSKKRKWISNDNTNNSHQTIQCNGTVNGFIDVESEVSRATVNKLKHTFNVNEKLPEYLQPKLIIEKINIGGRAVSEKLRFVKVKSVNLVNGEIKRPVIDPVSKKTIVSKYQCSTCNKYFSSNYCLNRHIATVHRPSDDASCHVCGEIFEWPTLMYTHKCFLADKDEANVECGQMEGDQDYDMSEDYMDIADYDIPAPIVELTEFDNYNIIVNDGNCSVGPKLCVSPLPNFQIVMKQVAS